ncbi:MAG TPA: hypothetical protein VGB77_01135 [Abditibacteriaceae bacterium]|jgi:hypothetical protein
MSKKKQSAAEVSKADLHQDEELHVTRTTPQGTQEAGADKGYERRDIIIRPTLMWFLGVWVLTAVSVGSMWMMLIWMAGQHREEKNRVSTPLYVAEQTRRYPELLPNPAQGKQQRMPWDHMSEFYETEHKAMRNYGLNDADGRPALPLNAARAVMSAPGAKLAPGTSENAALSERLPADSMGGWGEENTILADSGGRKK